MNLRNRPGRWIFLALLVLVLAAILAGGLWWRFGTDVFLSGFGTLVC